MCLHLQFVQRQDLDRLFSQGFNAVGSNGKFTPIAQKDIYRTKSGKRIKMLISDYSFAVDNPELIARNKVEKGMRPQYKFVRHYDIDPAQIEICNLKTGETEPLFVQVPCGYCEDCLASKISKLSNKVYMHSCTAGNPYFVTLTFDPENEAKLIEHETLVAAPPTKWNELRKQLHKERVTLIQKFLKRLRQNLVNAGFTEKLTYVIISERGKNNHFHFHALFWLPNTRLLQNLYEFWTTKKDGTHVQVIEPCFGKYVRKSWQFGFSKIYLDRDEQGHANAGNYLFKYMSKQQNWHEQVLLKSRIANEKVDEFRRFILDNPEVQEIECFNPITNQTKNIPITSWMLDKIMPSLSRSMSHRDRYLLTMYNDLFNSIAYLNNQNETPNEWADYKYSHFYKKFEPLYCCGFLSTNPRKIEDNTSHIEVIRKILKLDRQINNIYKRYPLRKQELIVWLDHLRKEHNEIVACNIANTDMSLIRNYRRQQNARSLENQKDNQ